MTQNNQETSELTEKIRQQFDFLPYPECDLEKSPKDDLEQLFVHSLVTPYYLRYQKVINTEDKVILDAGCGSGVKALALAAANPGAKIVGVDISEKSVELARQRLTHHGINNAEFHVLSLENIEEIEYKFDYINCDEVFYLLPDPCLVLQKFQSLLKPQGIIRGNLHSYYQRINVFRTQKLFKLVGLFDESQDFAIEVVKDTMESLKDNVDIKVRTWRNDPNSTKIQSILSNHLLQGDKGYTVEDLFNFLNLANLDFLSMLKWRHWELLDLFKEPENLPAFWELGLAEASEEEKLHLFELFHPIHRLLDFWAVQKDNHPQPIPPLNWEKEQWLNCLVHLHPLLRNNRVKEDLQKSIANRQPFEISKYIKLPTSKSILLESTIASCLLPLWEQPQPFTALLGRWLQIQPLNVDTLEHKTDSQAFEEIRKLLTELEVFTYILLELS
jgi:2-polyprenyl-3-methyl-5-hydroxy-6-metoxy-1,4-benzoquinol methylase